MPTHPVWRNEFITTSSEGTSETFTILRMVNGQRVVDAKIDSQDVPKVENLVWRPSGDYVITDSVVGRGKHLALSHAIMGVPDATVVDHRSHDTLDNRRANLNPTDTRGNGNNRLDNSSGFPGVYWLASRRRWTSQFMVDKKLRFFGVFKEKTDAVLMTFAAGARLFGRSSPYKTPSGRTAAEVFA